MLYFLPYEAQWKNNPNSSDCIVLKVKPDDVAKYYMPKDQQLDLWKCI